MNNIDNNNNMDNNKLYTQCKHCQSTKIVIDNNITHIECLNCKYKYNIIEKKCIIC